MRKYLSYSTVLNFEENDMIDDLYQETIEIHCQDMFHTECKRVELKVKLNSLDENDYNMIDYGQSIKYAMPQCSMGNNSWHYAHQKKCYAKN